MNLDKNRELFEQAVIQTSEEMNIHPAIIEKDYYTTKVLKHMTGIEPNIIFKGGTSLSKCYGLIERFSEDIDLAYDTSMSKMTEGKRKKFSQWIETMGEEIGLELRNPQEIYSRRNFNRYKFGYNSNYSLEALKQILIVEVTVAIESFPTETRKADSYIYQFLNKVGLREIIKEYSMEPFKVTVQSKERTFVDKVFAICDYYMLGNTKEHSRHLYDLYKLFPVIEQNSSFSMLVSKVGHIRKANKMCPSAQDDCVVAEILQEIIEKDIYKSDYKDITEYLLFDKVSYSTVLENLEKIATMNIWRNHK